MDTQQKLVELEVILDAENPDRTIIVQAFLCEDHGGPTAYFIYQDRLSSAIPWEECPWVWDDYWFPEQVEVLLDAYRALERPDIVEGIELVIAQLGVGLARG